MNNVALHTEFTGISLCSGIGMLDTGINLALDGKFKPILYVEREAFCAANLAWQMEKKFLDEAPIWDDVRTIASAECRAYVRAALGGRKLDFIIGGIPCQRSLTPENELAATMNEIYGPQRLKQLRSMNPALCSSRMWKEWRLTLTGRGDSFKTWKALVIVLRQDYSRRKNAAQVMGESAGSFWGSSTTTNARGSQYQINQATGEKILTLTGQVKSWPTPHSNSMTGPGKNGRTGGENLQTTACDWPTPNASNINDGENPQTWAERREKLKAQKMNGNGMGEPLAIAVSTFPATPQQEMTSELGLLLQKWTPPECPRLNPRFEEWLMGWPIGICNFTPSEMELIRWSRHTLYALFGLVCRKIESVKNGQSKQVEIF